MSVGRARRRPPSQRARSMRRNLVPVAGFSCSCGNLCIAKHVLSVDPLPNKLGAPTTYATQGGQAIAFPTPLASDRTLRGDTHPANPRQLGSLFLAACGQYLVDGSDVERLSVWQNAR